MKPTEYNELERRVEDRIIRISSKMMRFQFLMFTFIIIIIICGGFFAFKSIKAFDEKVNLIDEKIESNSTQSPPQTITDESLNNINSRISTLENLSEAIESNSKGALEQMNYVFVIVAGFLGLFTFFIAYRQIQSDSSREGHDQEMRSLVSSFQNNINTISSLIITLEKSFDYRKQVKEELDEMNKRATSLEANRNEIEAAFKNLMSELNNESVKLFEAAIDRVSLSDKSNRQLLENFAEKMRTASSTRQVEELLNPFCYYVRGLSNVAVYRYELAIKDFDIAFNKGRVDLSDTNLLNYPESVKENIKGNIEKLLVSCLFFQGISYKNIDKYDEAFSKFQKTIERDPTRLQARSYMLQIMFMNDVAFDNIEKSYEKTIEDFYILEKENKITRDELNSGLTILKIYQGDMYLNKQIPLDIRSGYKKFENQGKAFKYYLEAFEKTKNELTIFNLAQAFDGGSLFEWKGKSQEELYKEAMALLKKKVVGDLDNLYSVTLYYMLAICAKRLKDDRFEVYLSQARHSLREVPNNVTCFSPINKIRLKRNQILEEIEIFERTS